jgi:hypothetical protein
MPRSQIYSTQNIEGNTTNNLQQCCKKWKRQCETCNAEQGDYFEEDIIQKALIREDIIYRQILGTF